MHRLVALYLLLSGAALLGPHRPAWWPALLLLHLAGAFVALRLARARAAGRSHWLLDWYPLLLVPAFYAELVLLNRSVWGGRYFDAVVLGWERAIFGGLPSQELAPAMPWPALSEPLHAAYVSYYLLIYGPPLLLWLRASRSDFRQTVFALMLTFFVHYLFFIYFPVQGPRYLFDAPAASEIGGYPMRELAHALLQAGSSQGAAFPSSHVAVAMAATVMTARFLPRLATIVGILSVLLALGAVYGGFHYAVDAVVGAVVGTAAALATLRLYADATPEAGPA